MERVVKLEASEYTDFLSFITNLKDICTDIDIRDGLVRQRSDDKTSVFEIDLSSILPDVSMALTDIKKKLELLKIFQGQDEVTITINEDEQSHYLFSDNVSSIKVLSPTLDFIDNKFMTTEELESIFTMNEEDLVLDYTIQTMITERVRVITQTFNTLAIQVNFDGEQASISAATQAKDQFANFVRDIITNVSLEKCSANLSTVPFSLDYDTNVKFKMYKDEGQDITLNSFESTLGSLDIKIFTRSALVKEDEG